jgi:hypothetical protein
VNRLSELINNGVYPKILKVTRSQAVPITQHFETAWEPDLTNSYDYKGMVGYFRAYYTTRTGKQKYCVILFYEDC